MPFVFAYGSLQEDGVQRKMYGRAIECRRDELGGVERKIIRLEDRAAVAATGHAEHANLEFCGRSDSRVQGTVLEISDAELATTDKFEELADYKRIEVQLVSGTRAWAYIYWPSHGRR